MAFDIYPELVPGWSRDATGMQYRMSSLVKEFICDDYGHQILQQDSHSMYEDAIISSSVYYNGERYDVTAISNFGHATNLVIPEGIYRISGIYGDEMMTKVEFPKGIKEVRGVVDCSSLEEIILPENKVRLSGFSKLPSLRNVSVACPEPYDITGCFEDMDVDKCTLTVPEGSLDAYCATEVWRNFGIVKDTTGKIGIKSDSVEGMTMNSVSTADDVRVVSIDGKLMDCTSENGIKLLPAGIYLILTHGDSPRKVVVR